MDDERRREEEQEEYVIVDKRHSRELEDDDNAAEDTTAEQAQPEEVPPAAPESDVADTGPEVVEFPASAETESADVEVPPEPSPQVAETVGDDEPMSPQEAQMKMLFEMGLTGYLHGQLELVVAFIEIYLGRRPNPATGLVTTDLEQARLGIDLLEFITSRAGQDLPAQTQQGLGQLVRDLKMIYAQTASSGGDSSPPEA
jgi:hypothetical protein